MKIVKREGFVGAIDQGTTGTRFMVFNHQGVPVSSAYREHEQIYPQPGWVEHDPREIWSNLKIVVRKALVDADLTNQDLLGIGITNQRETVFTWDDQGVPLYNGLVWQDRRTADRCKELARTEIEDIVKNRTGLRLDPYFSGTKIEWLLRNINGLRDKARRGEAHFGTVESWLIWKLTGGRNHVTDHTNASRTMLFDIEKTEWRGELLESFRVPRESLPEPRENVGSFGEVTSLEPLRGVPIGSAFGDQQASLFGQACFTDGEAKNTYGTGSFLLVNIGQSPSFGEDLLTTIGYSVDGEVHYALEGSVYSTGATIQWLRDGLGLIKDAAESEDLARSLDGNEGVYLVPAFTGLGAPHWDSSARGTIIGLTRGCDERHLARAGLESICYQVEDVIQAIREESGQELDRLKVDGGAAKNDFLCQFQSDVSMLPVLRTDINESTALGAAFGAGLAVGVWNDLAEIDQMIRSKHNQKFEPAMEAETRKKVYSKWQEAVERAKNWV